MRASGGGDKLIEPGLIGGIVGGVIGVAGGAFGTFRSIRSSRGPLERAFMIKASVVAWIAISVFVGLMFVLPNPYRYLLWIPYGILLPIAIVKVNKKVAELRRIEESTE